MKFAPMLRLCLGLAVALSPAAASAQTGAAAPAAAQSWTRFTAPEGGLSALFPGTPTRTEGEIAVDQGGPGKTYFYTVDLPDSLFLAGWGHYAPSFKFDNQTELDANRDNFVKGIEAKLDSHRAITFRGAPGLEFDFSKQGALFGRGRVYIIDGKPYQLVAMHRGTALDVARVNRFLDSFRMTPKR
jgi:hypothetical protein